MKKTTRVCSIFNIQHNARLPLFTAIALMSAASFAADTTPITEEIIVTSSLRDTSLTNFAGAITVVDREQLAFASSLSDIARFTPGLTVIDTGPRNPSPVIIRGLRLDSIGTYDLGGDGGSVASYIDHIPLQGNFVPPSLNLKDMQQVEILRGPQGTLYGNASIAGLVRYVTAKPDLSRNSVDVGTRISQTRHSNGINHDTDLVINAPLIDDVLGVRLLLSGERNQGFIDNPWLLEGPAKDINDDKTSVARLSTRWQITPEWSLDGAYHYQKSYVADRQAANPLFTGDDYTASARYRQPVRGELELASITSDYQFSQATVTASVSRYDYRSHQRADQTDFLLTLDALYEMDFYAADPEFSAWTEGLIDVVKDSAELRIVSDNEQRLRWLAGLIYSTDEASVLVTDTLPGFSEFIGLNRTDDLDYYATQNQDLRELSGYAEVAYDVLPDWEVTLGARQFRYRDNIATCSVLPISEFIEDDELPLRCIDNNDRHTGTLGKFSTRYRINDDHGIYFTVAEGFRRGGANIVGDDATEQREYRPDSSTNYELGNHSYFFDQQLRISSALFYIDWTDIQVSSVVGNYQVFVNAPEARVRGIELEALASLSSHWSIRGSTSYTDAELSSDAPELSTPAFKGDRLPGSARAQWSLGVDYRQSIGQALLEARIDVSHRGRITTGLNDQFDEYQQLGSSQRVDTSIDVTRGNWRVGLFVHNLTDERTVTGKRSAAQYGEKGQFETITRPRTAGISVRMHY